ncbi:MAG: hypothetical protein QW375_05225 [Thermoplasmata archaeon]
MKIYVFIIAIIMIFLIILNPVNPNITNVQSNYIKTSILNENMTFYLKNDTITHTINGIHTTYVFNTTMGNRGSVDSGTQSIIENWYLSPILAGNFILQNVTSYFWIYIRFYGTDNNPNLYVTIYDVKSNGSQVQIGSGSAHPVLASTIQSYLISVRLSNYIIPKGDSVHINFVLSGGASTQYWVYYGNSTYASGISVKSISHLTINNIETLNYNGTQVIGFLETWGNKTMYINAILNDPLGGYDIKNVSLKIIEPNKNILLDKPMIKISGTPTSFVSIYQYKMNYSSLLQGNYTIIVYALDNNGYYYYQENYNFDGYLEIAYSYFWIGLPISVYINLYDTLGNVLKYSEISLISGNVTYSNFTNANGFTRIELFSGTYKVQIFWNDTLLSENMKIYYNKTFYTVGNTVNVQNNETINITADVGSLAFKVINSIGGVVPNALVYVTYPNGYEKIFTTNLNGLVELGISAGGNYGVKVYYLDQNVANRTYNIDFISYGNEIIQNVNASIYELKVSAVDSKFNPVQGEQIYISNPYVQLLNITNSSGGSNFLLPENSYNLKAYYMGVLVNSSNINVNNNENIIVNSSIYYLHVDIVGNDNKTINHGWILVEMNGTVMGYSNNTNSTFRLPSGNYQIRAYINEIYYFTPVNMGKEINYTLSNNSNIKLMIKGYPIPFYSTYLFYIILIIIIFAIIVSLIALRCSGKRKRGSLKPWEGPQKS